MLISNFLNTLIGTFDLKNRVSRGQFWLFYLVVLILLIVSALIGFIFKTNISVFIYLGLTYVPILSAGYRRIIDTGNPGWYVFIPIVNLILICKRGVT